MSQQPDDLFRSRLESYQKPVNPEAWDKVESRLNNRKRVVLLYKVAAALIPVAVVASVLVFREDQQTIAEKPIENISPPTEKKQVVAEPIFKPEVETKVEPKNQVAKESSRKQIRRVNYIPVDNQEVATASIPADETERNETAVAINLPVENSTNPTGTEIGEPTIEPGTSFTLTYSYQDVATYQKNLEPEATSETKKASGIKRLLKKARELKLPEDPMGELRTKKNEILALNFRSEKKQSNNK